jgi:uncharacterized protein YukE
MKGWPIIMPVGGPLYLADPQTMQGAAQTCIIYNGDIQIKIGQGQNIIEMLMVGASGQEFQTLQDVMARWQADAQQLNLVLETIAGGLNSNAGGYDGTRAQNTRNIVAAGAALPPAKF